MKNLYLLISVALFVFLTNCKEKGGDKEINGEIRATSCDEMPIGHNLDTTVCTDSLCVLYQTVWKEIFIQKNGLTEQYFNNHVKIINSDIGDWNEGTSFRIGYIVMIGWANLYNEDPFIIKIKEGNNLYPALNVQRGVFLNKEDIIKVIDANAFSSGIMSFTPSETLDFNSKDEAITFLTQQAKVSILCFSRIFIDRLTGHISLEANAKYDNEVNKCIDANLDLINRKTNIQDIVCFVDAADL